MKSDKRFLRFSLLVISVLGVPAPAPADRLSDPNLFQLRVLPILRENCVSCHGSNRISGLDMRTASNLLKGGSHGTEVFSGAPNKSRLYRYVSGQDKIQMPPGKRLSQQDVATLRDWIASGAVWPKSVAAIDSLPWAFRKPERSALPKVRASGWVQNPIDAFVLSKLEAQKVKSAPPADKMTLLRRVTFDLTGLPPTPGEVDAFLADGSQTAYEKVVDRLLASPRYGERWARHWLDLARYAESEGFKSDETRPNVWRYRDYVINSFNADKPYDRFIREQIAGDELYPNSPEAIVATGFNSHGPDESNATNLMQRRQEILNDITDTVGSSILGLTVGCARCHNHKYDPIPQKDYYRLQAFFAAIRLQDNLSLVTPHERAAYDSKMKIWEEKTREVRETISKLEEPVRTKFYKDRKKRFPPDVQEAIDTAPEKRSPIQWIIYHKAMPQLEVGSIDIKSMKPEEQATYRECQAELQKFASLKPPSPVAYAITDVGPEAPKTHTLGVGVYDALRDETPPGFLSLIDSKPATIPLVNTPTTGRRTALANWLTSTSNPLTARVMVNRLWMHHFGRGIVGTSSDFGVMGEKPTHPELLDWLASEFTSGSPEHGAWSIKKMQRLMVTSSTYRQSAVYDSRSAKMDPENRLLWRFQPQRLEGEAIRDAMLAVSGNLNQKMGGPSTYPELPAGITTRGNWQDSKDLPERNRRSIYVVVKRNLPFPLFAAFDMPDTHESCGRRLVTTTAPQALFLLNDSFALQTAQSLAARLLNEAGSDKEAQINLAYRLAFSRPPDAEERERALAFLESQRLKIEKNSVDKPNSTFKIALPDGVSSAQAAALVDFCHVLINAHEFVYTE